MNKSSLVGAISEKSGLSKKNCETVLNSFVSSVEDALANGEKVALVGFGSFEVKERPKRKVRNPQTGQEIVLPPSKAPVFKAGKVLKEKVN